MAGNASSKNKAVQQNPDHPHNRSRQESFVSLSIQARSSVFSRTKGSVAVFRFRFHAKAKVLLALKWLCNLKFIKYTVKFHIRGDKVLINF